MVAIPAWQHLCVRQSDANSKRVLTKSNSASLQGSWSLRIYRAPASWQHAAAASLLGDLAGLPLGLLTLRKLLPGLEAGNFHSRAECGKGWLRVRFQQGRRQCTAFDTPRRVHILAGVWYDPSIRVHKESSKGREKGSVAYSAKGLADVGDASASGELLLDGIPVVLGVEHCGAGLVRGEMERGICESGQMRLLPVHPQSTSVLQPSTFRRDSVGKALANDHDPCE